MTIAIKSAFSASSQWQKNLYPKTFDQLKKNIVDSTLTKSAEVNDNTDFEIDQLFSLLFENDKNGEMTKDAKAAETFIFDIFTDKVKTTDHDDLKELLIKKSLLLWDLMSEANSKLKEINQKKSYDVQAEYYVIPAKILLMSGFYADSVSQKQDMITAIYQQEEEFNETIAYNRSDIDNSIFDLNRYITGDEIEKFSNKLQYDKNRVNFFTPQKFPEHTNADSTLKEDLGTDFSINQNKGESGAFIPLLSREHWILFGIFTSHDGQKKALVFDSLNYLNENEKTTLERYVKNEKINEPIEYICKENLQENAPNACGLFVAKAMQAIAENKGDPISILNDFKIKFCEYDNRKQELFNMHGRAELYGAVLENDHL